MDSGKLLGLDWKLHYLSAKYNYRMRVPRCIDMELNPLGSNVLKVFGWLNENSSKWNFRILDHDDQTILMEVTLDDANAALLFRLTYPDAIPETYPNYYRHAPI